LSAKRAKPVASKLKPCPFCGAVPEASKAYGTWMVACADDSNCAVGPVSTHEYREVAVSEWNRRAPAKKAKAKRDPAATPYAWPRVTLRTAADRIEELERALAFYALAGHWQDGGGGMSSIECDVGSRARAALASTKGGGE
jgi:hypothetical protein